MPLTGLSARQPSGGVFHKVARYFKCSSLREGRAVFLLLSLGLHLLLAGLILGLSLVLPAAEEKYYQVALVDVGEAGGLNEPAEPPVAQPTPPPAEPEPQPLPEPEPEPDPAPPPQPEPKPIRQISPVKKPAPTAKPPEQPRPAPQAEPTASPGTPGPTRQIGGLAAYEAALVDEPPAVTRRVLPAYPARARGRVRGRVEISLVVDASGNPRELRVLRAEPAGYGFEEAALEAAGKTRFRPGKVRGRPVNTLVTLPFVFNIR